MPIPMTARQVLDREYLEVRGKLLEVAASLDRLDRAEESVQGDARLRLIREAIQVLQSDDGERAEKLQMIFSRRYDESWREKFALVTTRKPK